MTSIDNVGKDCMGFLFEIALEGRHDKICNGNLGSR